MSRAQLLQTSQLRFAARERENFGTDHRRELHAGHADTAAGAEHHHPLARLELPASHQHAIRRAVGERQRRRLVEADRGGNLDQHRLAHGDEFGAAAVHRLAQHAHSVTIAHDGIDEHPLAEPASRHTRPQRLHRPGNVGTDDHRQIDLDPRHAAAREQVVEIHRGGRHPHQHLIGRRSRGRIVAAELQHLATTVRRGQHRFHRCALLMVISRPVCRSTRVPTQSAGRSNRRRRCRPPPPCALRAAPAPLQANRCASQAANNRREN